jgi:hypothetical protein
MAVFKKGKGKEKENEQEKGRTEQREVNAFTLQYRYSVFSITSVLCHCFF